MNTTSSLAPPAMEDPFTDTMEMASPYQGHMDDFEIDIDIMEDQPTTADNDFDVQDASPASAAGDADMMEDVPEMTVNDTSHYNDSSMQYAGTIFSNQESYESEMVDEDYDDNSVTVPFQPEATAIPSEPTVEAIQEVKETIESMKDPSIQDEERPDQQNENVEDREETTNISEIVGQETTEVELDAPKEDVSHITSDPQVESITESQSENTLDNNKSLEQQSPVESSTTAIEEPAELHPAGKVTDTENGTSIVLSSTDETHEGADKESNAVAKPAVSYMHPVKVIYQDTEISMFPPRDGDTSETYFLANEGLAYETIDGLLKECRKILGDHASDEDSLVFHIDSLGIELSEDNIHTGKVTLSQLVDIYLKLCNNSGIQQPEPLYLALHTRANLSAEVAALLSAANKGKGISDIQEWDENYEQHEHGEEAPSGTVLSEQKIEQAEHDEEAHFEPKELQDGEQDNEWIDNTQYEDEGGYEEQAGLHDGAVEVHEHEEASRVSVEPTKSEQNDDDDQTSVASHGEHPSASAEEISETQFDLDETNSTTTLTQNPLTQSEDQPEERLAAKLTREQAEAIDDVLSGDEDRTYTSHEQDFAADSHIEQEPREEYAADEAENAEKDAEASQDVSEAVIVADNANGPEDSKELADQDFVKNDQDEGEKDEGEHNEDEYEEDYESYGDEEHHEENLHVASDTGEEFNAGHAESGEASVLPHGDGDDSYEGNQLDQVSSETVSVSDEPVDKNYPQLDDSQTARKTDALEESHEGIQQFPDLPDLPDDDLISLGDDFFGNSEEANAENEQGLATNQNNDPFNQAAGADDDTRSSQLKRQESNAGKRPRDTDEEDFGLDGTPSPGTKRTRSS